MEISRNHLWRKTTNRDFYTNGTSGVSYSYDRRNRLISATDVGGTHYFSYNLQNSLDNETIPYYNNRVVKYEYDNLGRNTKMGVYNTATNTWEHDTTYTYDSMSRLVTLASLGKSATYTRMNSSNRLTSVALLNDVGAPNINYLYDNQLRLVGKGGNSRTLNDKDEVQTQNYTNEDYIRFYSYDAQGQLSQQINGEIVGNHPVGVADNFTYDQIGNPLSNSFTYNAVNQPSNLTFDADGNMLQNGSKLYTYDAGNRLKTVGSARSFLRFYYDYAGRCFKRTSVSVSNGTETETVREYLIYNGTKIIAVVNRFGIGITEKYTWQPSTSGDADVLLWDASGIYVTDCNKNIVARYYFNPDAWQNLIDTYSYTAFGVPTTSGTGNFPRFLFSSEEYNVSENLYFYLYRVYNPPLKRWLTRDPIEENGGVNLYNFLGNNPISYLDNLGLDGGTSLIALLILSIIALTTGGCDNDIAKEEVVKEEDCRIIIAEGHCNKTADNELMKYVVEKSSPRVALGIIGCHTKASKNSVDIKYPGVNWIYDAQGGIQDLFSVGELRNNDEEGRTKQDIYNANVKMAKAKAEVMCLDSAICCSVVEIWFENRVAGVNKKLIERVYCEKS